MHICLGWATARSLTYPSNSITSMLPARSAWASSKASRKTGQKPLNVICKSALRHEHYSGAACNECLYVLLCCLHALMDVCILMHMCNEGLGTIISCLGRLSCVWNLDSGHITNEYKQGICNQASLDSCMHLNSPQPRNCQAVAGTQIRKRCYFCLG